MQCELCGREGETVSSMIEDVELKVCAACARHGKTLKRPVFAPARKKEEIEIPEIKLVESYQQIIRRKREELGMTQDEFAKHINEKSSTYNSIESGHLKPDINFAEKMKRMFGLRIIEEIKKEKIKLEKAKTAGFTLGDFIKKN